MRERTPRGGRQWAASSVKNLLDQAEKLGLAPSAGAGRNEAASSNGEKTSRFALANSAGMAYHLTR